MNRPEMLNRVLDRTEPWDLVIIGGGATGVGCAVDAASRGYEVLLLEQSDFGKGTSSRSTKLVHGGVRYLEQGNISLVIEALRERGILRQNAPHLVTDLAFVVPSYDWWESPFYGLGLKVYDVLAGKYGFGPSQILSREETLVRLPTIKPEGLRGGIVYYDGQFDDSRLLINLAETAADQGAILLNYAPVTGLTKGADGFVDGVEAQDAESGQPLQARAKVVINATGPFSDHVRRMADPSVVPMIAPSQGVHLVFDRSFLPGNSAIMVPHTSDGRVMFAIPWNLHTLVGTTDTPIVNPSLEPRALPEEIDFILETAGRYLHKSPTRADVLSVFVGIRPLVSSGHAGSTAAISRDHTIHIDGSGLLSIAGGKWTTYRRMAEDCIDQAATLAELPEKPVGHRPSEHPWLSQTRRQVREPGKLRLRQHRDSGHHSQRAQPGRAAPSSADLLRSRGDLGSKSRDGEDRGRRSGAADTCAFSQCTGGFGDGPASGRAHGPRTSSRRDLAIATSARLPGIGRRLSALLAVGANVSFLDRLDALPGDRSR